MGQAGLSATFAQPQQKSVRSLGAGDDVRRPVLFDRRMTAIGEPRELAFPLRRSGEVSWLRGSGGNQLADGVFSVHRPKDKATLQGHGPSDLRRGNRDGSAARTLVDQQAQRVTGA